MPAGDDFWAVSLRRLGDSLGRFIYLTDALTDLEGDRRKGRYNPLLRSVQPGGEEAFRPALELTIGDCANELERLPLVQDLEILRDIIYSGVWVRYASYIERKHRRKE